MTEQDPTLLGQLKFCGALVAVWLGGEVGRLAVAGAAGGFVRALMAETRRYRDGIVAMITGGILAIYATPLTVAMLDRVMGPLNGDAVGAAGFATGVAGMSMVKLLLGMIEAHVRRITGGRGDA